MPNLVLRRIARGRIRGADDESLYRRIGRAQEGSEGWVTFYGSVDEVEEALKRAESLGGTRLMGPMDVPDGPTIGLFNDPEGHLIGLVKSQPIEA